MKCEPVYGLGVRHIQYGLLAVMNCLDFWLQALNIALYLEKTSGRAVDPETWQTLEEGKVAFQPDGRVILTSMEHSIIHMGAFGGYTLGRLISAWVVLQVSNKYLLLSFIMFENLAGALLIWFTKIVGFYGIALFHIILSFTRSFHPVLMYNMLAKWMPPCEYTSTFCLNTVLKEVLSFFVSRNLVVMSYMESQVFYMMFTFVYLAWCCLFLVFGSESPQTSFLISKKEWTYLSKKIGPRKKIRCKAKIPWKSIFKCGILYTFTLLDFGKEAVSAIITQGVRAVAGRNELAGATMICLQAALMIYSCGLLASCMYVDKRIIGSEKIEPGPVRKVMVAVACCGVAITMILTAYVDQMKAKIVYLFLAQCSYMILNTAGPAILFDLSPNYAAPIYAVVSCVRNFGIVTKIFVDPKLSTWDLTLKGDNVTTHIAPHVSDGLIYRYGFLIFFMNVFFIISGNIELKDFDSFGTQDWRKESVISYP